MSISIPQFLRRTPVAALTAALYATRTRFAALEPTFRAAFAYGLVYPWRALAAFAPEKVFSDLIEAVSGAIYIDTNGNLKVCMAILREVRSAGVGGNGVEEQCSDPASEGKGRPSRQVLKGKISRVDRGCGRL